MRLVPEAALTGLLRNLTKPQAHRLLSNLSATLEAYSKQNADPKAEGPILQPLRTVLTTAEGNARLFMPAADAQTTSIKVVTVPKQGDIRATISLFATDGSLKGLLAAAEVTAFRTALATMTLLTRVSGLSKAQAVVFGAGKQAEWHARLLALLFGEEVRKITVVNRTSGRMSVMCNDLSSDLAKSLPDLKIEQVAKQDTSDESYSAKLREVLGDASIICCCTPSTEPLFRHSDLGSGPKFLSMIGSYKPHMQEIDTETLLSGGSKVFVDSKDACLEEAGEIIRAGLKGDQLIELGDHFAKGQSDVSVSATENIVFKCVGMGIMDLTIAETLLEMAVTAGVGQDVEGF